MDDGPSRPPHTCAYRRRTFPQRSQTRFLGNFPDRKSSQKKDLRFQASVDVNSISVMGQKRTSRSETAMSALPPEADIAGRQLDVRRSVKERLDISDADQFSLTVPR